MHESIGHTFISGVGCRDWEADHAAQARYEELIPKVQDGDIILLHDFIGNDNTVTALRQIIPELKKQGFTFVTVSQLFEKKGITPEPNSGYIYTNVMQEELSQAR
jgi:peptidoglycan/xylan/chitin deacetylase (PgdA/CDA1 family)